MKKGLSFMDLGISPPVFAVRGKKPLGGGGLKERRLTHSNCSGANYLVNKTFKRRSRSKCRIQKLVALFIADMEARRIAKKPRRYDEIKLYHTIEAIDLFGNSVSCLTSPAKHAVFCGFQRLMFGKLKFPNISNQENTRGVFGNI